MQPCITKTCVKFVIIIRKSYECYFTCEKGKNNFKMEPVRKNVYTKPRQYEIMVDFMVQHSDLAKGHLNASNAKSKSRELWERLSLDLNAAGPPTHEVEKWKKVWADYKQHIKVKSRRNKSSLSGTGGGISNFCSLTQLEQQVADLLAINESVDGMSGTYRYGAKRKRTSSASATEVPTQVDDIDMDTTANDLAETLADISNGQNTVTPRSRRNRNVSNKDNLLTKQVENQIKYQENSLELLTKIDENQKGSNNELKEINKNLLTLNKYLKRSFY
ncbi:uncharacterized protein LOC124420775 [Lucilia cuprina]|uniref:uncharacterized protein LOC124420775 n=1 Tax=Lucilia cuprina TaxID=7375 RepID=UPI001F052DEF|nr:uncharacterized protein LOC124420775 [Lucilia cuprina]